MEKKMIIQADRYNIRNKPKTIKKTSICILRNFR